ncbi:MFS transporter [Thomasclavelia sp.]|uniref:MFS transporter n=1 Tax=Thomasclavelia sp. TaxID=3025757 RepID=UPI0025ED9C4D|nr:MFS transporter [Thomasclavelia sp.]
MKKVLVLISIFSVSFLCQIRGTLNPGMYMLYQHFSDYPTSTVSLMINICSLAVIPTSYIIGKLTGRIITYKKVIIGMNIFLIVGGVGPFFVENLYMMLIFRLLFGVGIGIAIALHKSLILEYYSGKKQIKYLGYATIVASIGTIFFQTIISFLGKIYWKLMFFGYLPIVITLLFSFFLPDISLNKPQIKNQKEKISSNVMIILGIFLVLNMTMTAVSVNQSSLFSEKGFENAIVLAASVGNVNAIFSVLSGFVFDKIYQRFKDSFIVIAMICSLCGILVYILGKNEISMYFAAAIFGFFYNFVVLYLFLIADNCCQLKNKAVIGGYMAVVAGIGGFLATALIHICEMFFYESIYSVFIIGAVVLMIGTIVVFYVLKSNNISTD